MTAPSIKEALERQVARIIEPAASGYTNEYRSAEDKAARIVSTVISALATFQPDGERRGAIARMRRSLDQWSGCSPEAISKGSEAQMSYFVADAKHDIALLASGLVQDEAGWRDISTAPKNHFPILTWSEQGGRCVAFLDVTWTWWPCPATEPLSNKPTHWKPLPAPPIRSARDGGSET